MTTPRIKTVIPLEEMNRLLIVKTSSIGDVVHALPVIEVIKQARPHLEIDWVVRNKSAGILRGNPHLTTVHVLPNRPSLGDIARLRRVFLGRNYDCALDMQGLWLSGVITVLSGAPVRIGLDRNREGNRFFMTHPVVPGKVDRHTVDRHAVDILFGFAEALGLNVDHSDFAPQTYLASEGNNQWQSSMDHLPRPRVALNVGASWLYKQWPEDYWVELSKMLIGAGYGVVFVGDANDAVIVDKIVPQTNRQPLCLNLAGKTDLRQLASALAECDVLISADTGPMHLGVAVGVPVVALFGATNPIRTGPYGRRNTVLDVHLSCSPCYRKPTCQGRVDCMKAITPADVMAALNDKLSTTCESLNI